MATIGTLVTKDWADVTAALSLASGTSYKIQNTGQSQIQYSEQTAEPTDASYYHILDPGNSETIEQQTEKWWFRTFLGSTKLSVTPGV